MYFRIIRMVYFNTPEKRIILGRWSIPKSRDILERKIYLANYDHCGPCGKINIEDKKNRLY
jgi:hypothetical protein